MEKDLLYPVDTANFKWIRQRGFVYVDKTGYIPRMTKKAKYYFLARPRRFGKSLFLDTLAEYFKGNKQLFEGLRIADIEPEEWPQYPVVRINLSGYAYLNKEDLEKTLTATLSSLEVEFNLTASSSSIYDRFYELIQNISKKTDRGVAILIDEYDSPLSSTIDNKELQEHFREQLHAFYSNLKKAEEYIHFCMLTGVTRYGKVSVFSGLNNLKDISFSDEFAGICGVTQEELSHYYGQGVKLLAKKMQTSEEEIYRQLKFNYDGYHFSNALIDVYNPYSINHVFGEMRFGDYWCRSGVPTILSKSLMQSDFDVERLNGIKVSESDLSDLSVDASDPVPLFYQTGYLTIKAFEERRKRYTLGYPNREVEAGVLFNILKVYTDSRSDRQGTIFDMQDSLEEGNVGQFIKLLSSFLSDIPNQLHRHVNRFENFYHTIFYCITTLIGLDVEAEYSTSEGFIDMVIKTANYIYIIELKVNGSAEDAINQIEEKHYAAPFAADSRKIVKLGIGFSTATHSIASYRIAQS